MLTKQGQQQKQQNARLRWEKPDCEVPVRKRVENFHYLFLQSLIYKQLKKEKQ